MHALNVTTEGLHRHTNMYIEQIQGPQSLYIVYSKLLSVDCGEGKAVITSYLLHSSDNSRLGNTR